MFPAGRFYQVIDCIIGVICTWFHPFISKIYRILNIGIVLYVGDVPGWIIIIDQILKQDAIAFACGNELV